MPAIMSETSDISNPDHARLGRGFRRLEPVPRDLGTGFSAANLGPMAELPQITIPSDLPPADGRFGCGPSKVRPEAVSALSAAATDYLGTSHRQATVRFMVSELRNGLAEL